jgi:hypothetical protein
METSKCLWLLREDVLTIKGAVFVSTFSRLKLTLWHCSGPGGEVGSSQGDACGH